MKLTLESVDHGVKQIALPNVGGLHNVKGLKRTKGQRKTECSLFVWQSSSWNGGLLLSLALDSEWNFHLSSDVYRPLDLDTTTPSALLVSSLPLQILGLLSLHDCMS